MRGLPTGFLPQPANVTAYARMWYDHITVPRLTIVQHVTTRHSRYKTAALHTLQTERLIMRYTSGSSFFIPMG
jgi:hypothetical protein